MTNNLASKVLDEAARAAWLYYVGGKTQDEIAKQLSISRQRAQRLISRAMDQGLVRVRLEHPIAELMSLEGALKLKFGIALARVAPDIGEDGNMASVAPFAAKVLERVLEDQKPKTIAFGTGRALRATVESMRHMTCEHHKLVSLIGNISPDGSASFYDVIMRISDIVLAAHYPFPAPVVAENKSEKTHYASLKAVRNVIELGMKADAVFVGIGHMDETAPLLMDGFISAEERKEICTMGAVGEIIGSVYDNEGNYIETSLSERLTSMRIKASNHSLVVGIAAGTQKINAIKAALKGNIINGLVTDEATARKLL